ncbi:MAG TPA: ABC transporter ATP-binding protein [Bacteroidota bacterium]|nr:ABC transporter ATP-binding protein [Bacteroidota bacterium]
MNAGLKVTGEGLRKEFDRRTVFRDVSFSASPGQTLLVTGRNGSGKSTLVKIICGVLTPSGGTLSITPDAGEAPREQRGLIGLVSPYLQMFDEFSAVENLEIAMGIRGLPFDRERADALLERVAIFPRRHDPVRTYSSGMKQRVKYAFALIHLPPVLVLDEPMSNLDGEGIDIVRALMAEQRRRGILVVATNDLSDIDAYEGRVDLNERR